MRLYGAIDIDGTIYRVKTTVKRYNDSQEKTKAYSYEVTEIELLEGTLGDANKPLPRTTNSSITGAKLLNGVENSKGEPILKSSKVVDENGGNHIINENALKGKLKGEKESNGVVYINETLSSNSSDNHLAETANGLPDLLPTQDDSASQDKTTIENQESQEENKKALKVIFKSLYIAVF